MTKTKTTQQASKPSTLTSLPTIAIIGSGYWGKNLVRNYQKLGVFGASYGV